jgi:hypothetical protein
VLTSAAPLPWPSLDVLFGPSARRPRYASLTTAMTIAATTKTTIAICIHTQLGDMRI